MPVSRPPRALTDGIRAADAERTATQMTTSCPARRRVPRGGVRALARDRVRARPDRVRRGHGRPVRGRLRGARSRRRGLPGAVRGARRTTDLTPDERIDRDLAMAMLRGRLVIAEWQGWRRDPLTYSGPALNGIFLLFLHRLRPDQDLVDAAVRPPRPGARRCSTQGRANLDPALAHPLHRRARRSPRRRAGARYVRELLPAEVRDAELSERLRSAGVAAARGVRRLGRCSWRAFAPSAHGTWVFGEERYSRIAPGARGAAVRCPRRCASTGQRGARPPRCRDVGRSRERIAGTRDWHEVIERSTQDHPLTEEAMRQAYEVWTARARDFLATRGLVSLPDGEECRSSRRRCSSGRCWASRPTWRRPPSATRVTGHFFVPFAPDGTARRGDRQAPVEQQPSGASRPSRCTRRTRATTGTW